MLVVQGMAEGQGGEVFVLDMGEAIRIEELARNLINLSRPDAIDPVDIVETGLRPGEKLREQYLAGYGDEDREDAGGDCENAIEQFAETTFSPLAVKSPRLEVTNSSSRPSRTESVPTTVKGRAERAA